MIKKYQYSGINEGLFCEFQNKKQRLLYFFTQNVPARRRYLSIICYLYGTSYWRILVISARSRSFCVFLIFSVLSMSFCAFLFVVLVLCLSARSRPFCSFQVFLSILNHFANSEFVSGTCLHSNALLRT